MFPSSRTALMTEALSTSKAVQANINQTTRCNIQEDSLLHTSRPDNLQSRLDACGSEHMPVARSCEQGNEHYGSIKTVNLTSSTTISFPPWALLHGVNTDVVNLIRGKVLSSIPSSEP
jgi:hypothetical protein